MNRGFRAVSPVVAVILMVAVTVVLSAVIGAFVFNIGQSTDSSKQSIGVSMSQTSTGLEVTVVTGEADTLQVLVDGEPARTIDSPSPGDSALVTVLKGDDISLVSMSNGEKRVISTSTITMTPSISRGLLSHYNFESGDGTISYDTAGDNEATLKGANWTTNSTSGHYGVEFDGSDDYVRIPHDDSLNLSTVTLTAWVNPDEVGVSNRIIIDKGESSTRNYQLHFKDLTGNLSWYDENGGEFISNYVPTKGEWVFVSGTYTDGTLKLYANGRLVGENTSRPALPYTSEDGAIGTDYHGYFFNGSIDDVRIYNRALSSQEISDLYNATE